MSEQNDPFGEPDETILHVIERWGELGDDLVIEGHIEALGATAELKKGEYNANMGRGHVRHIPGNLKCDLIVRKPRAEIIAYGGDLAIVAEVLRQLQHIVLNTTDVVLVEFMDKQYKLDEAQKPMATGGAVEVPYVKRQNPL